MTKAKDHTPHPVYLKLLEDAKLMGRLAEAKAALHECHLCGNNCALDRTQHPGPCGIGATAYVASYGPHLGEEDVLRGWRGSGTIFFSGCNLHCVYCQNYDISQTVVGQPVSPAQLAGMMLDLQAQGCHNVNLVSPTHVVPHIIEALALAIPNGLRLPLVYNTGGYDTPQALHLMDSLVDIYMPDMKYADDQTGRDLSGVADYPATNQAAVKEMHRQVGDLTMDNQRLARRGLLIRHLVLPGELAGTDKIARFLAEEVSLDTYINVMGQYHPAHKAWECATPAAPLDRRPTPQELRTAREQARAAELHRFDDRSATT